MSPLLPSCRSEEPGFFGLLALLSPWIICGPRRDLHPSCFPLSGNKLLKSSFEEGEAPSCRNPLGSSYHLVPPLHSFFPSAFPLHLTPVLNTFGFTEPLWCPSPSPCRLRALQGWHGEDGWGDAHVTNHCPGSVQPCLLGCIYTGNTSSCFPLSRASSAKGI